MTVSFGLGSFRAEWPHAVACIGTFDGVHLGHQAVIREAANQARAAELPLVLATFDRHPAAILAPERCPKALEPLEENLRQFRALGVGVTIVLPFDETMAEMSAEAFLKDVLIGQIRAERLVVGHDFAMGHNRVGTTEWLRERFPTTVVPPFEVGGNRVSSSVLRRAVEAGEMTTVTRLLGRPFVISGVVVGGQKLGRTLGFPTANLARAIDGALPSDGVYAAWFQDGGETYMAAVSIGTRPAVGGGPRSIEAYLLDYGGASLYGKGCRLSIVSKLRDEWNFPNLDALVEQITKDVDQVRTILTHAKNRKAEK